MFNNLKNILLQKMRWCFSNRSKSAGPIAIAVVFIILFSAIALKKDITVVVDGKQKKISTYKGTVGELLSAEAIKLDSKDKVLPGVDSKVKDHMVIAIKKAVPVSVNVDGKTLTVYTAENTLKDTLKQEGIILNESDKISPALDSQVKVGMEVNIVRVEEKTIRVQERIAYKTTRKADVNLELGTTKILQDGMDGEKEIAYKAVYENGKEVARVKVGEVVKKTPVDKILAVGSLAWFTPSRGSQKVFYVKKINMKATAYTADYNSTGKNPGDRGFGITASGARVKRIPHGYSTVAVDPRVIPLGTRLYVQGYGYAIAEDTGGAIKGNKIDLYFHPGSQELRSWGNHKLNVYVLK
jgi:uncharacterized protein YabE (DUF348 family)